MSFVDAVARSAVRSSGVGGVYGTTSMNREISGLIRNGEKRMAGWQQPRRIKRARPDGHQVDDNGPSIDFINQASSRTFHIPQELNQCNAPIYEGELLFTNAWDKPRKNRNLGRQVHARSLGQLVAMASTLGMNKKRPEPRLAFFGLAFLSRPMLRKELPAFTIHLQGRVQMHNLWAGPQMPEVGMILWIICKPKMQMLEGVEYVSWDYSPHAAFHRPHPVELLHDGVLYTGQCIRVGALAGYHKNIVSTKQGHHSIIQRYFSNVRRAGSFSKTTEMAKLDLIEVAI